MNIPVQDAHSIPLPKDMSDGVYAVRIGLYRWPDLQRLSVSAVDCRDSSNDVLLVGYTAVGRSAASTQSVFPTLTLQK